MLSISFRHTTSHLKNYTASEKIQRPPQNQIAKKIREISRVRVFGIGLVPEQTELRRKSTSLT